MSDAPARRGVLDVDLSAETEVAEPVTQEEVVKNEPVADDPNEPIFDDGPTGSEVEEWKRVFGDVYMTSFGPDRNFVWRTLSRTEYRDLIKRLEMTVASGQVSQAEANLNNEESLVERCLLWPRMGRAQISAEMAGVASIIAQEVMEASGFVAMDVRQL